MLSIKERVAAAVNEVSRDSALAAALRDKLSAAKNSSTAAHTLISNLGSARNILIKLAEKNQQEVVGNLNAIMQHAFRSILDDDSYTTDVVQGMQRKTPVARLVVEDDGFSTDNIIDQRGGGLVAIASFVLSVLIQTRSNPNGSRTFIIDERFNFVPRAALPAVAELLSDLAKKGGCQFILVTHQPELIEGGDVVYELTRSAGATISRRLTDA